MGKTESPFGSKTFWSDFTRRHWEKTPGVFSKPRADIFNLDAAAIFDLLVRYCEICRANDTTDGLKFYVDGVRLESFEALEHLPVAEDKSLTGYHRRMEKQFDDYGLVCDELMQVKDPRWKIVRAFMDDLYEHVGLPNRFSEIGLYLGNYKKTPFGVHVDKCGVLSFPVVGSKTFRLWTPQYVQAHPELEEAFSYDEFKKQSVVLKAEPGDMTYWPSTYWHIAENDGRFNATWSIGIWVDRPTSDIAIEALQPLIEKAMQKVLGKTGIRRTFLPNEKSLPKDLKEIARAVSNLSQAEVTKALELWWKNRRQNGGFKKPKTKARER